LLVIDHLYRRLFTGFRWSTGGQFRARCVRQRWQIASSKVSRVQVTGALPLTHTTQTYDIVFDRSHKESDLTTGRSSPANPVNGSNASFDLVRLRMKLSVVAPTMPME
jgi:hypothetical protein